MKSYLKLFLVYGVASIFVGILFVSVSQAETKTIQKNQMSRIGLRNHSSGDIEVFFFSQGKFYYFPEISAADGPKKASVLIQLLRTCRIIAIHDLPASPQGSNVAFRDYTFEF
ncbi:MAG: hypothetical protein HYY61_04360 [Deltaproteobacteria bacterium]|nr:hypothetical protein [Deltaproteobacteria bacterium]